VALLLFRNKKRFRRNNFTSNSRNLQASTAPPTNSMGTFSQLHKNVIVVVGCMGQGNSPSPARQRGFYSFAKGISHRDFYRSHDMGH
jgi:hypothetical protein